MTTFGQQQKRTMFPENCLGQRPLSGACPICYHEWVRRPSRFRFHSMSAREQPLPIELPSLLHAERRGNVALLRLARPEKRNSINDEAVLGLEKFFTELPDDIGAVLLYGEGDHFCAGLDLTELKERDVREGVEDSRLWHCVFEKEE